MVKNSPAMQETRGQSLGQKEGKWNGNPLQYSCLENSMNRVWRATVHGVAKSQTTTEQLTLSVSNIKRRTFL